MEENMRGRWILSIGIVALVLSGGLTACGSSGGSDGEVGQPTIISEGPPAAQRLVIGAIDTGSAIPTQSQAVAPGTTLTINDGTSIPLDPEGRFEIRDVQDGSHSLFLQQAGGTVIEVPFRMLEGRSLSLGTVRINNNSFEHTGFNGFHFGFVDANNDGINDLFVDADGDGICDNAGLYAGYPFLMGHGFVDADGDGINDNFRDANGDSVNDVDGRPFGPGFGLIDANGDGIDDRSGLPFRHPFGFADGNGDRINDRFRDVDGNGVNDITGVPYTAMPGWVDLDGDGICDFFTDVNGDGINDRTGLPFGHGFGWADADGDGINDRFRDRNGDGVNDVPQGPFVGMPFHPGFDRPRRDANGDGLDDVTGLPFRHGFGWVDADGDGVNDAFIDVDGDGINDRNGHHYDRGFLVGPGGRHGTPIEWPGMPFHTGGFGPPATTATITGSMFADGVPVQSMRLNDGAVQIPVSPEGRFELRNVPEGNHSLMVQTTAGTVEIPFRMVEGRSLNFGNLGIFNGQMLVRTGFDGYRFGFVDEDGDGLNDLCRDDDGNGICDPGTLFSNHPFLMGHGFVDADGNGINDLFRDHDGEGRNDLDDSLFGPGFGFVDADNDGINDRFRDVDGDGICDVTRMPFRHPFGFVDDDGDGLNDRFRDRDGDGVNDLTGAGFIAMPGWVDLNNDGFNDFFRDDNGDGINDVTGIPFGHGFGWADADGDRINDRFQDLEGNGVNDVALGPFAGFPFHIGFAGPHVDVDGNGIDDRTGSPYRHGFGWVDLNGDGINDAFVDANGDGINDRTNHHYDQGFMAGPGGSQGGHMGSGDWPMGPQHGGGMR
jgi:hypothetical protein